MAEDPREKAARLAETLKERGHAGAAEGVAAAVEHGLLRGLRDALQSALTAIEAIDPVSAGMIDELRLEVDKRLGAPHS
ncbi:MAG: hypothetical protein KGI51_03240 [Rhodospirillales bacterium]|nr:hypothetical protein [Rhodospirillales bacterium]